MRNVFLAYHKNPNTALRNKLVELNLGLARAIAHSIAKNTTEPYEDLEQVAFVGLIAAVERYNPTTGLKFSTYAVPTIQGKVLQYLRDKSATIRIPQSLQDLHIQKGKTERKLAVELGRDATRKEVIEALDCESDRLTEAELAHSNKFPTSLNRQIGNDDGTNVITLEDTIASPAQQQYTVAKIPDAPLAGLNEQTTALLQSVFLSDSKYKGTTVKRQLRKAIVEFALTK